MSSPHRTKLLYHILGVLLLVSVLPLTYYGWKQIRFNRELLETKERIHQSTIAESLASEISRFVDSYREQLQMLATALESRGMAGLAEGSEGRFTLEQKLQKFAAQSPRMLYVSLVNTEGKGIRAGSYNASDDFIQQSLLEAFSAIAGRKTPFYITSPTQVDPGTGYQTVAVVAVPYNSRNQWGGAIIAILSLEDIVDWVKKRSVGGESVYVVDVEGRIVVHPEKREFFTGRAIQDDVEIVKDFVGAAKTTKNSRNSPVVTTPFQMNRGGKQIAMLGTHCIIPEPAWGVIVQIEQADAFASVAEMKREAIFWGALLLLFAVLVGVLSTRFLVSPLQQLTERTRAIAQGDFSQRITIRTRTEIGELADTFNKMTGSLQLYVEQLQLAVKKNRDLFIGTIRALAAAIDEKDPYTRGHSERVTEFSTIIGRHLGLNENEMESLRIAALLHDIGKIGVDDSVLKKPGVLSDEEFEVMKQHPVKGANIMNSIEELHDMTPGMRHHHEHWNGNGYPDRLKGKNIPLVARIISVADTLDAMTSKRLYQRAFSIEETCTEIQNGSGSKYDPQVVTALAKAVEQGDFNSICKPPPPVA
jgi:HD-GYP domain-containing protein (c-di-GMP phosphodiesterase class II)